jgi:hypothetical protein
LFSGVAIQPDHFRAFLLGTSFPEAEAAIVSGCIAKRSRKRTSYTPGVGEFSAYDGLDVEQVWVWFSLRLVFDLGPPGKPGTYVDVTEFEFTAPDGALSRINVESDPVAAGAVLGVLHHRVARATVEDWVLRLDFENGAKLVCPPHERFEAWQAQLPDARTPFYCPPGGGPGSPT